MSIIGQRVRLEVSGSNFKGLCPFHNEKTPSFFVYPDSSSYYCFGCKASGTVIDFMMETENVPYFEALVRLAHMTGVQLPRFEDEDSAEQFDHLYALLQRANSYFRSCLNRAPENSIVKRYLRKRGLSEEVISTFDVGYAPEGWDNLKKQLSDANEQDLQAVGLTRLHAESKRTYDYFRDRLTFPIRNLQGKVIGFGGRAIKEEDQPKYLNSPKSPIFDKGTELYGFFEVTTQNRRLERLVFVEGYMDVLALAQYGIDYAVATLGTATSMQHFESMFRRTREVICCFDADEAGRKAAWSALTRALGALREERAIRFVFLPDGHDPDTFVREKGIKVFEELLDDAVHVADYLVQQLSSGNETMSVQERVRFADEVTKTIQLVPHVTTQIALKQEVIARFPEMTRRLNELLRVHPQDEPVRRTKSFPRTDLNRVIRPYLQYLFHSANVWQYLTQYKNERDFLEAALPNNPLIEMWDRIVNLKLKTTSSLLATYQGTKGLDLIEQIAKARVTPVSKEEFHDGIQTLVTRIENLGMAKESLEQRQRPNR